VIHPVHIDIFGRSVVLVKGETKDSFFRKIKGKIEIPEKHIEQLKSAFNDLEIKNVGACAVDIGDQVIIFRKEIKIDYLVHELVHAIDAICITLGINDTETRAYMIQYLFNQFSSFVDNNTKRRG